MSLPTITVVALVLLVVSSSLLALMYRASTVGPLAIASAALGGIAVGSLFVLFHI